MPPRLGQSARNGAIVWSYPVAACERDLLSVTAAAARHSDTLIAPTAAAAASDIRL